MLGPIRYRYIANRKDSLAVILPGASLLPRSHNRLIQLLSKKANVLLIEDGYFGLRILDGHIPMCKAIPHLVWNYLDTSLHPEAKTRITDYNRVSFCKNLHSLIRKYPHKRLVILSSSVGTIHGLTYALAYPNEVDTLVLAALPIGSKMLNFVLLALTHLLLSTSPEFLLKIVLKTYLICSRNQGVVTIMERTRKKLGLAPIFCA